MDGTAGRDRILERIVAILLSLALLAERAANRSFPVRWLLLAILRRAESLACFLVWERTGWQFPCSGTDAGDDGGAGSTPADALLLAARLRMLAAFLSALLPDALRLPGRRAGLSGRAAGRAVSPAVRVIPAAVAAAAHDTS